jgi:hypothetical protein
LIRDAEGAEFFRRAFGFAQRRELRTAHEHERCRFRIGQRVDGGFVNAALLFQSGQRTEAGGAAGVFVEKLIPRLRQTHQAQRVAGGRGVEDDVVVGLRGLGIADEAGEFVKGGDLDRAGAGKLLLHAAQRRFRQQAAHGADQALAIRRSG